MAQEHHQTRRNQSRSILLALLLGAGCAANPGTRPQEVSATQRKAAAAQQEQVTGEHQGQNASKAQAAEGKCGASDANGVPVCWSDRVNPTKEQLLEAQRHHQLAEKDRAASLALRNAEAQACEGVSTSDRDMSPFAHRTDIRSGSPTRLPAAGLGGGYEAGGATVVLNPVPGLTRQLLQRIINCHLARNAALGYQQEDAQDQPLALKGVEAEVHSLPDGFAVEIRARDRATAKEIWRRAQALAAEEHSQYHSSRDPTLSLP